MNKIKQIKLCIFIIVYVNFTWSICAKYNKILNKILNKTFKKMFNKMFNKFFNKFFKNKIATGVLKVQHTFVMYL